MFNKINVDLVLSWLLRLSVWSLVLVVSIVVTGYVMNGFLFNFFDLLGRFAVIVCGLSMLGFSSLTIIQKMFRMDWKPVVSKVPHMLLAPVVIIFLWISFLENFTNVYDDHEPNKVLGTEYKRTDDYNSERSYEEYGDWDCSDFDTWEDAQYFFEDEGGPESDYHNLDRDGNGIACESLR